MNMRYRVRVPRRKYTGRGFLIPGALLLLIMTGYEAWVRWDTIQHFIRAMREFSEIKGESFIENMAILMQTRSMRELTWIMLFLLACILLSVITLCLRNRPLASIGIFLATGGLFFVGCFVLSMLSLASGSLLQVIKLIPIILILAGCVMNLSQYTAIRHRMKMKRKNQQCEYGQGKRA